jgi:hypothetical protein
MEQAELGRHDSSVMRLMAIDSNRVARSAHRDSTDMRSIAVLTLLFLPGMFTAVSNSQIN